MEKKDNTKHLVNIDDDISIIDFFYILLHGKWIIISVTAIISIIGVIYSLSLPNIYESKALLVPSNSKSNITGALGNYNSLAGLAGINIPPGTDDGNSAKAIKKIVSLSFFENNIMTKINLPDLMAVKSWQSRTNTLNFDEDVYDSTSKQWVREYSYPMQQIPSAQEGFVVFKSKHLSLNEDKKTGFISLSIKHQSPFVAKQWVELIIDEINGFYREKDRLESEIAVSYLNEQISKTALSEIKQVLALLLQEETKKLTLIEANQFYVFEYIDPPAVMENKSEPRRALICFSFALFGGMLSIILVFIRYFFSSRNSL